MNPKLVPGILNSLVGILMALLVGVSGCAALTGYQEPMVNVVGLEPLPGEGLELRFALTMRVQNPNEQAIDFDGISLSLDIDGRGVASGVSDEKGTVPRFGETVVTVPVSVSAFTALRQALSMLEGPRTDGLSYSLQGRFGGRGLGGSGFSGRGKLDLPAFGGATPRGRT